MNNKAPIFLFLFSIISVGQTKILKDLDKENDYEFYISASQNVVIENENVLNNFIFNDQAVIQNIIKTWKGKKTNSYFRCGYNYDVYIICNNKIIETIAINDECNQLVYSKGAVDIKENPFAKLNSDSKFSFFYYKAKTKAEALPFLKSIKDLKDVYCGNCDDYDFTDLKVDELDGECNLYIFGKPEAISKINNYR